jgi:hypothetical protein
MSKSNYRKTLYLGTTREDFKQLPSERIYLSKHSWECGWYWGFGYIGNSNLHAHFKLFLEGGDTYDLPKVFSDTKLTQNNWWAILEMFSSAYKLREAAGFYNRGGSQITKNLCGHILKDKVLSGRINKDLELVLDTLWKYIEDSIEDNTKKEIANDA